MTKKIFAASLLATLIFSLVFYFFTHSIIYEYFETELISNIRNEAFLTANALEFTDIDIIYLESVSADTKRRITLIESDGAVLYDSLIDEKHLENHINRPEIAQACKSGTGESVRHSSTLNKNMYYFAIKLDNGNIIRISASTSTIDDIFQAELPYLMIAVPVIVAITALLILRSKKVNKKTAFTDMTLFHELEQAADSISVGIVFLAADKTVLYANKYAVAVIDDILSLHSEYNSCIDNVLNGVSCEKTLTLNKKIYKLSANAVTDKRIACAAIIFISDVTETESKKQGQRHSTIKLIHNAKKTKLYP